MNGQFLQLNTAATETFAPDSAWKMAWIMDDSTGKGYDGDDDICLPTWPDGQQFRIGGNDNAFPASANNGWVNANVGKPGTSSNWFSFNGWNRLSSYLKGGTVSEVDNGILWFSGISSEFGQKQFLLTDRPLFDGDDNTKDNGISQWTRLNLSGWHRTINGTNASYDDLTKVYYDDIYFATGPNAAARVEIGNNKVYENCTHLTIAPPVSWSSSEVSAIFPAENFLASEDLYVFIIDSNNNSSAGYGPFRLGDSLK